MIQHMTQNLTPNDDINFNLLKYNSSLASSNLISRKQTPPFCNTPVSIIGNEPSLIKITKLKMKRIDHKAALISNESGRDNQIAKWKTV